MLGTTTFQNTIKFSRMSYQNLLKNAKKDTLFVKLF